MAQRILGFLLILGAIVTAIYWWSYFSGGEVMTSTERWYTAFESAFPVADGWMALCMAVSGVGLIRGRAWARPVGLLAGSALMYLALMDITFNVENGLYALAATSEAMKAEVAINVSSGLLGIWTILACWPRSRGA